MGASVNSKPAGSVSPGWAVLALAAAGALALTVGLAPGLNNKLFQNNKNMIPVTGTLWILALPETGAGGEISEKSLLKIAEPARQGGQEGKSPGMMYLSRFKDGQIRPRFFFDNMPTAPSSADQQAIVPFRYRVDLAEERKAMAVIQGRQVLMLLPTQEGFDDVGPVLLEEAARGRRLQVRLELKPDWIFEADYDVSEMTTALDQFKKGARP